MTSRIHFLQTPAFAITAALAAITLGTVIGAGAMWLGNPVLLIAGVVGVIGVVTITLQPHLGLVLLAFITYTRFSDVLVSYHGAPSVAKAVVPLLFGVILFRWFSHRETPSGWLRPALFIGIYGFVAFLSLLYAADASSTLEALSDFAKDSLIALIVVMLLQNGVDFRRIVWVLLLAGIFMGSISTYQYLTGAYTNDFFGFGQAQIQNIIGQTSDYRVSGPVGDANFYAQIMVTLVPLALERLWNERNLLLRLVAGYALAVCLVTIIATFSRGGFLALIVMLVALLVVRRPRFSHLLMAVGVAVLFIQFAPAQYLARLGTLMDFLPGSESTLSEVSLRGRTSENAVGWLILGDHPILGVGLNNYPYYYLSYARDLGLESRLEARAAHSLYLQIAAEQGIIGLAAFGVLMFGVFHSLQFAYHRLLSVGKVELSDMTMAYGVGLMGYLTAAIFLHNAYPRFFWLLIGIAFALREVAKTETAPAPAAITDLESVAVHG